MPPPRVRVQCQFALRHNRASASSVQRQTFAPQSTSTPSTAWRRVFGDGPVVSAWSMLGSPYSAELLASVPGYNAVTIDLQHGMGGQQNVLPFLSAVGSQRAKAVPLVRLPSNSPDIIGHCLDAGASGLICPLINSADDAQAFVEACMFAPNGTRSFGPLRAGFLRSAVDVASGAPYQDTADDTVVTMAMIETQEGLDAVDAIASTPRLTALFIGPFDLGLALGVTPGDVTNPVLREAIRHILGTAHDRGRQAAIFCGSASGAREMLDLGFDMVIPGSDVGLLTEAAANAASVAISEDGSSSERGGVY
jgi:4-hydroxy-2-oxoheptanedioate aldolase